jgi:hypothetical protein
MNSRYGLTCLVVPAAALLAACSSTTMSSLTLSGGNAPYFVGERVVTVDTAYIDRYLCSNGAPLLCERGSRVASTAVCRCP